MKRRLILLAGSFLFLLLAFGIYKLATHLSIPKGPTRTTTGAGVERPRMGGGGLKVFFEDRNDEGELQGLYTAKDWQRFRDGSVKLTGPRVTLYRGNQNVYITADHGEVYTEEVGKQFRPVRGKLIGNVQITMDRAPGPDKPDLKERPEDLVRIFLEDVSFDQGLLELRTANEVQVLSSEADIDGKGVQITWNEKPQELLKLVLLQGRRMLVKNVPADMQVIGGPGSIATTESAVPGPTPEVAKEPLPVPVATTRSTKPGPTRSPGPAAKPKNIYEAHFEGKDELINIVSGDRRMNNARDLVLNFDWSGKDQQAADNPAPTPKPRGPRPGPTKKPGAAPTPGATSTSAATTRPAGQPMEITWKGPLTLVPIGYTATPSKKRFRVQAQGDDLVLSDRLSTAHCRTFDFHSPEQKGELTGTVDKPVHLTMASGEEVDCPLVRFNVPAKGSAELAMAEMIGAGTMIRPSQADMGSFRSDVPATTPATTSAPAGKDKIIWQESVLVHFSQQEVIDSSGKKTTKQVLHDALFKKGVELTEGRTGNFIQCDQLDTTMARASDGRTFPSKAIATGHVFARQDASDIQQCDLLTVTFTERSEPDADGKMRQRIRPSTLEAFGKPVTVIDRANPQQVITASAEKITAEVAIQRAVLIGSKTSLARVSQGENSLEGPEIHLDNAVEGAGPNAPHREMVMVIGGGKLRFRSVRDMEGRELAQPKTISIDFANRMDYAGIRNRAFFDGNVKLASPVESPTETLACKTLELLLEKDASAATQVATAPGGPSDHRRMRLGMENFSKRKIAKMTADGDAKTGQTVQMDSLRTDDKGRLERRVRVKGPQLVYDAATKKIDIFGAGQLLNEDYRPPDVVAAGADAPASADPVGHLERPAQTLFVWTNSMQWLQPDAKVRPDQPGGQVTMMGSVQVRHRSGNKLVLPKQLNLPKMPDLTKGRTMDLDCQELTARFAAAPKRAATTQPGSAPADSLAETGPTMGPLENFKAVKDVNLVDGPMQVLAQQVNFDRVQGVANMWGYLIGQPKAKAHFAYEDPQTGKSQQLDNPEINVTIRDGRVVKVVTDVGTTGGGAR